MEAVIKSSFDSKVLASFRLMYTMAGRSWHVGHVGQACWPGVLARHPSQASRIPGDSRQSQSTKQTMRSKSTR